MATYSYFVLRMSYVGKVKNLELKMQNYSAKFKNNHGLHGLTRILFGHKGAKNINHRGRGERRGIYPRIRHRKHKGIFFS